MIFILTAAAFVMAIVALNKISTLNARLTQLSSQLADLVTTIAHMREIQKSAPEKHAQPSAVLPPDQKQKSLKTASVLAEPAKIAASAIAANTEAVSEPISKAAQKRADKRKAEEPVQSQGNAFKIPEAAEISDPSAPAAQPAAQPPQSAQPEMPAPTSPKTWVNKRDLEQKIASQWLVWVGGLAIAIGGLLFVKYAYDNGFISPTMQVLFGLLLAAGLIYAGDRLRRASTLPVDSNYVPAALSAAGLVTAFGSIFAAYALYELIQPTTAFIGLALVGLGALALSLRQGPLIAALGLLGSYATPTIIPSENPSAWTFFPYLLIIMAACFAVLRQRPWHWLGFAAIAGSAIWAFLWMAGPFVTADTLPLGMFTLCFGAISMLGLSLREALSEGSGSLEQPEKMSTTLVIGATGMGVAALVLTTLVINSGHSATALLLFFTGIASIAAFSWFKQGNSFAAAAAALLSFLVLMAWRQASFIEWAMDENGLWSTLLLGQAPQFLRWTLTIGAAFTLLGLAGYLLRKASIIWAAIAAASAFLFLAGAWARVDELLEPGTWALLAVLAAAALLSAVWLRRQHLLPASDNLAAGILSIGSALLMLFASDRLFDSIWLTLAIAVLALAYAALTRSMAVHMLGPIAAAFGTLTTLRLFASRQFWLDDATLPLGLHWPLYGYGIPVVLFLMASRLLKAAGQLKSAVSLEAISLGLAISLVSLELRVLISGGVTTTQPQLLEMSTHILTWLGAAYGLLYRQQIYSGVVAKWGARILLGASCLAIIGASLLVLNPVLTGLALPGSLAFNTLSLAYLAPAALLWLISKKLTPAGLEPLRPYIETFAALLFTVFVNFQIKRFYGATLYWDPANEVESALHILAWLGLACLLVYRSNILSPLANLWSVCALVGISGAAIVFVSLFALNPVISGWPLQGNAIFNSLILTYLAPIPLLALIARRLDVFKMKPLLPVFGGAALALVMTYLTLETKRLFQGPFMVARSLSNGENYAYSAVWLAAALALFLGGIRLSQKYLRYAGLGVIILVVLKVFLRDMSGLEGLLRIASFIGLGLSLVGIGWLYQRFVQKAEVN